VLRRRDRDRRGVLQDQGDHPVHGKSRRSKSAGRLRGGRIPYCWQHVPTYSVYNLFRGDKREELLSKGILDVADIPEDFDVTPRQAIEIGAYKQNRVHLDLWKYCRLDTLAEVKLLEELYRAVC
jgi:hypothetical protein